jgi:ABC-2 type transport system permease protein
MSALLWVEVRRYLSRRLVWVMLGLSVLGMVIAGTVTFIRSHALDPAAEQALIQRAEAEHRAAIEACKNGAFGFNPGDVPTGESIDAFCERVVGRPQFADPGFHFTNLEDAYIGTSALLVAVFVVLAGSFIGAEWHAGTLTTLLTWEPRRVRIFVAKTLVAAGTAFVGLLVLQAVLGLVLLPAALFRGTTLGVDAAWARSVLGLLARAGALAAMAAALACSLAWVGRNTAAALGIAFGYIAVVEPILHAVRPKWQPWFVGDNAAILLLGNRAEAPITALSRSTAAAGVVLGIYVVAALVVAGTLFVRRDVT